jgi:hypothetical protein
MREDATLNVRKHPYPDFAHTIQENEMNAQRQVSLNLSEYPMTDWKWYTALLLFVVSMLSSYAFAIWIALR